MALNGKYIKKWRKARHLSARDLGLALGYRGRDNVSKIENGWIPLSQKFAARFTTFACQVQAREYRERKIESRYALPKKIKILARPRRCAICRKWFIFPNATDRVCPNRACRRIYARKFPATKFGAKDAKRSKPKTLRKSPLRK